MLKCVFKIIFTKVPKYIWVWVNPTPPHLKAPKETWAWL